MAAVQGAEISAPAGSVRINGDEVSVVLPGSIDLTTEEEQQAALPGSAPGELGQRLLLIDPDNFVGAELLPAAVTRLRSVAAAIQTLGHVLEPTVFPNPRTLLGDPAPVLLVVDRALLPDGPAALAKLFSISPGAAIIVISTAATDPLALLEAGAQDVVVLDGLDPKRLAWSIKASVARTGSRVRDPDVAAPQIARLPAAIWQSSFGTVLSDLHGVPTLVNPAACEMLGRCVDELVGKRWEDYRHPDDEPIDEVAAAQVHAGRDSYSSERRYVRPDGSVVWVEVNITLVRDGDDRPSYFFTSMHDITSRKELELELATRALHDALTELPNRALLNNRLEHSLASQVRSGSLTGVAFLDVDGFKNVNDALGHSVGDLLLVEVGRRLSGTIRSSDTVARFGGDEFVVVCEDATPAGMSALAGRIADTLGSPLTVGGHEVGLNASVGITISRPGSTPQSLLSEADAAMYRAKELGRGRAVVFDDSLRRRAAATLEGEKALRSAISSGELVAYYQPVFDIFTERPVGVEALVRWEVPDGPTLLPAEFISLAESNGLIVQLGEAVLSQAVSRVAGWNRASRGAEPLWVSVNLSARQLLDPRLTDVVAAVLQESGLTPGLLLLEITETVLMTDVKQSIAVLEGLRELGVGVAIDDFGTGYSSLSYLKQLPVDIVKVDQSFVGGLGSDPDDTAIVKAVIGLGHALGVLCLAEGVETLAQKVSLVDLGCHMGQGFLWSRALTPSRADEWARARDQTPAE